jgi:hypothetical protein
MNAEKYLGRPCKFNHLEGDTGQTLRLCSNGNCCKCSPAYDRAKRTRRRDRMKALREQIWGNLSRTSNPQAAPTLQPKHKGETEL